MGWGSWCTNLASVWAGSAAAAPCGGARDYGFGGWGSWRLDLVSVGAGFAAAGPCGGGRHSGYSTTNFSQLDSMPFRTLISPPALCLQNPFDYLRETQLHRARRHSSTLNAFTTNHRSHERLQVQNTKMGSIAAALPQIHRRPSLSPQPQLRSPSRSPKDLNLDRKAAYLGRILIGNFQK